MLLIQVLCLSVINSQGSESSPTPTEYANTNQGKTYPSNYTYHPTEFPSPHVSQKTQDINCRKLLSHGKQKRWCKRNVPFRTRLDSGIEFNVIGFLIFSNQSLLPPPTRLPPTRLLPTRHPPTPLLQPKLDHWSAHCTLSQCKFITSSSNYTSHPNEISSLSVSPKAKSNRRHKLILV